MKNFKKLLYLTGAMCFVLTGVASATPMGQLNVTNCSGGGVTVTLTTIDWLNPPAGGNGCLASDTNTNVIFTGGGPLLAGDVTGLIKDLPALSNLDFMIFTDQPNLHFDLLALGPAPSNTTCSSTVDVNNPSCSVIAGSPFTLTPNGNGTTVTLAASGIARDTTGQANWGGSYTTQFAGLTPLQLQNAILSGTTIPNVCSGGACTSTYSGSFNLVIAPEPGTVSMFLLAGVALIGIGRKRFNKI